MHVISINGSNAQKSKLRNGHKVRVKHGAGFNVIVSPNTYHIVSRAFLKNKGIIARAVGSYGLGHCLRFTIGKENENRAVIAALTEFMVE